MNFLVHGTILIDRNIATTRRPSAGLAAHAEKRDGIIVTKREGGTVFNDSRNGK